MDEKLEKHFDEVYEKEFEGNIAVRKDTLKKRGIPARRILIEEFAEVGELDESDDRLTRFERKTTEYGKLADRPTVESGAAYMGKVLGAIDYVGKELGEVRLSPLVESSNTAGPSTGYFVWDITPDHVRLDSTRETTGLSDNEKRAWKKSLKEAYEHDDWYLPE